MGASALSVAYRHLSRPAHWYNFIQSRQFARCEQTEVRMRTGHSLSNELDQTASCQPKFHSDRFACFRHSFYYWSATSQCTWEAVLWKSSLLCWNVPAS